MGRNQWAIFGVGLLMVVILYFGFDIRPPKAAKQDKERSLQAVQTSAAVLIKEKTPQLNPDSKLEIQSLSTQLSDSSTPEDSVEVLKALSGTWFSQDEPAVAGFYAKQVADILNTAEAWSIAGTTFAYGLGREMSDREKEYIIDNARQAFENAISLEPSNIVHRVNLAVTYVEAPPENNPMKGIQMLLSMNEEYPENAAVLFQLGRFGMQTGQYDKAIGRLEKVVSLEPNRIKAYCLLSEAYLETGQPQKAQEAEEKCTKQN